MNVEEFENYALIFTQKVEKAKILGAKNEEITALLEKNTKEYFLDSKANDNNLMGTPCYNVYEIELEAATAGYALCSYASSPTGWGPVICLGGYGIATLAAGKKYESCLDRTYK